MPLLPTFEWDQTKNLENQLKHGVSFEAAKFAFLDPGRLILEDLQHSPTEHRYFCIGMDENSGNILTVRFTYRTDTIRIFGAGYWRRGRKLYEEKNQVHR